MLTEKQVRARIKVCKTEIKNTKASLSGTPNFNSNYRLKADLRGEKKK